MHEIKELLAKAKASLVADVIETKKNGRYLDQMKNHKDVSKDSLDLIDNKKKFDFYKSKLEQAEKLQGELHLKLREQSEQKKKLKDKLIKWKERMEKNEEPLKKQQQLQTLNFNIAIEEESLRKEKV